MVLQIEKIALLTHSQEYKLITAKLTSTPYKMLKRIGKNANWQHIKRKLEGVYSPIAKELHAASDLHQKQRPDDRLQEYIQDFMDVTEKAMGITQLTLPTM